MGSTVDKLKGKVMKKEGELTDDKLREAQGWATEKKGEAEGAIDRAADKVEQKIDEHRRDRDRDQNP